MLKETLLSGQWNFSLDPDDIGQAEDWHLKDLNDNIDLPGSVDQANKTPLNTAKSMAHLTRRHPFVGKAWYSREFEISPKTEEMFHHLALERVHGELNVWIDGYKLGRDDSLSTENRLFIGKLCAGTHKIVLMIDNSRFEAIGDAIVRDSAKMADVAHATTDHTQTNWNGVIGYMRIESSRASITQVDVFSPNHNAKIKVELDAFDTDINFPTYWHKENDDELILTFELANSVSDTAPQKLTIHHKFILDSAFTEIEIAVKLPTSAGLWDEFNPVMHNLIVEWYRGSTLQARKKLSFGIRNILKDGKRVTVNGRPIFLRGTLDCCIFPLTGYPPTNQEGWRKVFQTVKNFGLNHVRYHSYCPPEAAFQVADEMGVYLHVETPVWPVLGADPNLDRYIHAEAQRIVDAYGNHPSFIMFCVGNEVHGDGLHAFLERFIAKWKAIDKRRIYAGGSGWPTTKRADYSSKPGPRNHAWLEGLNSRLNARPLETLTDWSEHIKNEEMPLLSHEIGQWCAFPNLDEISKYTGVLDAGNYKLVKEDLIAKNLISRAHDYFINSGILQAQLYKEEMEATLRTSNMLGTQLLGLQDFPGQGTALVGLVDAFWDVKPYVAAKSFNEFCAPIVPLIRTDKFVLEAGQVLSAKIQLAQFGPKDLQNTTISWCLKNETTVFAKGEFEIEELATGYLHNVGDIEVETTNLTTPNKYELEVKVDDTEYCNRWNIWVMPADSLVSKIEIVHELNDKILQQVQDGATMVFSPSPETMIANSDLGHTSIFWNTFWTDEQAPHTLGLLNNIEHPVFDNFPADCHSDWHWWELTFARRACDISGVPFSPIVNVIDDWNKNRDLVLLAEAQIGEGRLILSAIDLSDNLESRPVARAFRNALSIYCDNSKTTEINKLTVEEIKYWWQEVAS